MGEKITPNVVGKLSRELRAMATIEWEVPDFFGIEEEQVRFQSPTFSFMGAMWHLEMHTTGKTEKNSSGWIGLYLIKENSVFKEHHVTYRLGIKKEDGVEYDALAEGCFVKDRDGWGTAKLVQRSALLRDKDKLSSRNIVKFFCRFREKIRKSEATESEIMLYENFQTLQENLKEMLNGEDGDVVLKVQDREFMAHKAVLRVRSPVFRYMFNHKMKEDISGVVEITDCDPTAFGDFLHFVYCGKIEEFSTDRVFDLYFVADKYDVDELKIMCSDSIIDNLSKDTFFDALNLALKYQESTMLKHATNFFIQNAIEIVETAEWLSFQKENPVTANELFIKTLKNKIPEK